MLVVVGLVEISDAIIRETGPVADRVGSRFVRNHPQRQVVALEIAVITMPPYPHPHMMRPQYYLPSGN